MGMIKFSLIITLTVLLTSCYNEQKEPNKYPTPNEVVLVAIAPDGTKLWGCCGGVYFASSGVKFSELMGKIIVDRYVPTGNE